MTIDNNKILKSLHIAKHYIKHIAKNYEFQNIDKVSGENNQIKSDIIRYCKNHNFVELSKNT